MIPYISRIVSTNSNKIALGSKQCQEKSDEKQDRVVNNNGIVYINPASSPGISIKRSSFSKTQLAPKSNINSSVNLIAKKEPFISSDIDNKINWEITNNINLDTKHNINVDTLHKENISSPEFNTLNLSENNSNREFPESTENQDVLNPKEVLSHLNLIKKIKSTHSDCCVKNLLDTPERFLNFCTPFRCISKDVLLSLRKREILCDTCVDKVVIKPAVSCISNNNVHEFVKDLYGVYVKSPPNDGAFMQKRSFSMRIHQTSVNKFSYMFGGVKNIIESIFNNASNSDVFKKDLLEVRRQWFWYSNKKPDNKSGKRLKCIITLPKLKITGKKSQYSSKSGSGSGFDRYPIEYRDGRNIVERKDGQQVKKAKKMKSAPKKPKIKMGKKEKKVKKPTVAKVAKKDVKSKPEVAKVKAPPKPEKKAPPPPPPPPPKKRKRRQSCNGGDSCSNECPDKTGWVKIKCYMCKDPNKKRRLPDPVMHIKCWKCKKAKTKASCRDGLKVRCYKCATKCADPKIRKVLTRHMKIPCAKCRYAHKRKTTGALKVKCYPCKSGPCPGPKRPTIKIPCAKCQAGKSITWRGGIKIACTKCKTASSCKSAKPKIKIKCYKCNLRRSKKTGKGLKVICTRCKAAARCGYSKKSIKILCAKCKEIMGKCPCKSKGLKIVCLRCKSRVMDHCKPSEEAILIKCAKCAAKRGGGTCCPIEGWPTSDIPCSKDSMQREIKPWPKKCSSLNQNIIMKLPELEAPPLQLTPNLPPTISNFEEMETNIQELEQVTPTLQLVEQDKEQVTNLQQEKQVKEQITLNVEEVEQVTPTLQLLEQVKEQVTPNLQQEEEIKEQISPNVQEVEQITPTLPQAEQLTTISHQVKEHVIPKFQEAEFEKLFNEMDGKGVIFYLKYLKEGSINIMKLPIKHTQEKHFLKMLRKIEGVKNEDILNYKFMTNDYKSKNFHRPKRDASNKVKFKDNIEITKDEFNADEEYDAADTGMPMELSEAESQRENLLLQEYVDEGEWAEIESSLDIKEVNLEKPNINMELQEKQPDRELSKLIGWEDKDPKQYFNLLVEDKDILLAQDKSLRKLKTIKKVTKKKKVGKPKIQTSLRSSDLALQVKDTKTSKEILKDD